jgi:SAM-dependent MidA family methyltransferase
VIYEVYVDESGREVLGSVSRPELAADAATVATTLGEGQRHGVSLEARTWLREAASHLESGFILTVDYGKRFASGTPNAPRAYRQHEILTELSAHPGTKDLTVPADFEALIREGAKADLALESYGSLSSFLIEGGIEAWLADTTGVTSAVYKERAQIKTLVHPEGMGETFKVLIQRKSL